MRASPPWGVAACPDAQEWRMLRAIVCVALEDAWRHGAHHACFRGFEIRAWRVGAQPGGACVWVRVTYAGGCVVSGCGRPGAFARGVRGPELGA